MPKPDKTNAMRMLDTMKIPYEALSYENDGTAKDGVTVAHLVGESPERVYKTLVTLDDKGAPHVCVLPADKELDLKAAARHFNVKSLAMEKVKDLKALTGYVRGGCSPIGMKKPFPTVIEQAATQQDYVLVSAGKIGLQLKIAPQSLALAAKAQFDTIVRS